MKLTATTVAIIASMLLWTATFYAVEATYHIGQAQGVFPNLHIKERIGLRNSGN